MNIAIVINTIAGRKDALSCRSGIPHRDRAYALQNFILPYYCQHPLITEVIVVGEWYSDPNYQYIASPAKLFNTIDCLKQRQLGFETSTSEWIIHQHDDHFLDLSGLDRLESAATSVIIPKRCTRLRQQRGEELNNGSDSGYIGGHCALFHREVLEACPWKDIPFYYTWDPAHTKQIIEAGFSADFVDWLTCWDVELGGTPWV